jgi:carboxyl-terminal processing protease
MFRRCLFASFLLVAFGTLWSGASEPDSAKPGDTSFARHLWMVTDVVLEHHIDPPARQQMLLDGVRKLLAKSGAPVPSGLGREISAVTTPEQFDTLVKKIVPAAVKPEVEAATLEGMLVNLPGRAHWFDAEEAKMTSVVEHNNYVGVGIQIRMHDKEKLSEIVVPIPGGTYRRAGGKTHDLLVEVDGKSMAGVSLSDVVKALRGPEGTEVTILVRQPGSTETRLLKMLREIVPFQSAIGYRRVSEEGYDFRPDPALPVAYVRLSGMTSSTYHELRGLDRRLRSEGIKGLVLDLRGTNPGTIVHAAQVADALLDGGPMWKVKDSKGRVTEYKADQDSLFRDWPMVVLVNEITVETTALIAEALQDRGRAVLVGGPSPAGGTVKSRVPMPDGSGGINMSTGIVERIKPSKSAGITPDHTVHMDAKRRDEIIAWSNGQESPEPPAAKPPHDAQLAKALDVLREALKEKKEKTAG